MRKIIFICVALNYNCLFSQIINFPEVGKPMPYFELNDVNYYNKKTVSIGDLNGKWYVLDFWLKGCKPCIESFPKIDQLVKNFKGQVEIFQIGIGKDELKSYYNYFREKENLDIPMAFDTKLASDWQINTYPTIFIVDNKGILRVVTHDISKENLKNLVFNDKNTFIQSKSYEEQYKNDITKPYFIDNNGANDSIFMFRSLIAKAEREHQTNGIADLNNSHNPPFISEINMKNGLFQLSSVPLYLLYNVAYFGQGRVNVGDKSYEQIKWYDNFDGKQIWPNLSVKDSTDFRYDFQSKEGFYIYSLNIPKDKASRSEIMRHMRLDLEKYFGYKAKIVKKETIVWKFIVVDKKKADNLKSTGMDPNLSIYTNNYIKAYNTPFENIVSEIASANQLKLPFINKTNFSFNIDIEINSSMKDLKQIKIELKKFGIDIIKGKHPMDVLIISDN